MKLVELNLAPDLSQATPQSRPSAPHSWQARIDQLLTDLRPLMRSAPVLTWPLPAQWERDDDGLADAKTLLWDPVQIDARLDQLTNQRWLRPWQRRGEPGVMAALIDEVDATGVDRHTIAAWISPEALRTIEHNCFQ